MWKINQPPHDPASVFSICTSKVRDADLKTRLENVAGLVNMAAIEYRQNGERGSLHLTRPHESVGDVVTKDEMVNVYKYRMVKKGSPGREIYDELMSLALHGRCPLCGKRHVSTLDHYLPKSYYPSLAVVPFNLVPSCGECNEAKIATIINNVVEQTLHPYFDDIESSRWLYATVLETSPPAVHFFVDPPAGLGEVLIDRIKLHFKIFRLGQLYSSEAADEILNIRHQLRGLYAATGATGIREELVYRASSCRDAQLNSWRTASYEAFAKSEWFCNGGFYCTDL